MTGEAAGTPGFQPGNDQGTPGFEPGNAMPRSYMVIGAGAMGIYYGGLLHNAGFPVTFLSTRQGTPGFQPGRQNFTIESLAAEIVVQEPRIVTIADNLEHHDVAIITLKTTQNHILPELLPRILKPNGTVVFLQNGIGVEEEALSVVARERILIGMCYIGVEKTAHDRIRHVDGGRIVLGQSVGRAYLPADEAHSQRLLDLAHDFQRAGIPVQQTDDILRAQWQKLLWNIPFNGLSVVLDRFPHEIASQPSMCTQVETIMREILAAARATGHPLPDALIPQLMNYTRTLPPFHTSMRMDYDRGRDMELKTMYENPIALARAHGVAMPATERLFQRLTALGRAQQLDDRARLLRQ
jgi:2-dehydropantoate 2-reductase